MKKERNRYANASLTVEAALVMPVILFVIVVLFFYLLFLYNRCILSDAVSLAVKQTAYLETESNRKIKEAVKEKCEESLAGRLVGVESAHLTVSVGKFQTKAEITANLRIPSEGVLGVALPFRKIKVSAVSDRLHPAGVIRLARKGKKIQEWFKGSGEESDEGEIQTGYELQLPDSQSELQLISG